METIFLRYEETNNLTPDRWDSENKLWLISDNFKHVFGFKLGGGRAFLYQTHSQLMAVMVSTRVLWVLPHICMSRCSFPSPHNILFVWAFDKYVCVLLRAYLSFCAPVCVWVCVVKCHSLLLCMQVCVDAAGFGECAGWRAMQANRFFFFFTSILATRRKTLLSCFVLFFNLWKCLVHASANSQGGWHGTRVRVIHRL